MQIILHGTARIETPHLSGIVFEMNLPPSARGLCPHSCPPFRTHTHTHSNREPSWMHLKPNERKNNYYRKILHHICTFFKRACACVTIANRRINQHTVRGIKIACARDWTPLMRRQHIHEHAHRGGAPTLSAPPPSVANRECQSSQSA